MRFWGLAAVAMGCLLAVTPAQAKIEQYSFEKPHTQIGFYVPHMGFSHSHGRFMDFEGEIVFDRDDTSKSSVNIKIDTNSVEMNGDVWNEHVKNTFLKPAEFPMMTFKSSSIEVTGERTANITGNLTLLGVTKPVVLETTFNKEDMNPFSKKYTAGFSAKAALKRSDFGMDAYLPAIGDDVEIRIEVEAECNQGCPTAAE